MEDVLSRSADEASRRNGGGNGEGGAYRDAPGTENGQQGLAVAGDVYQDRGRPNSLTISTTLRPPSNSDHTASKSKAKGRLDVKQAKGGWRAWWNRVLSVPAFESPLTKILSPLVTRAQWEVIIRSGIFSFVISSVVVAVPAPWPENNLIVLCPTPSCFFYIPLDAPVVLVHGRHRSIDRIFEMVAFRTQRDDAASSDRQDEPPRFGRFRFVSFYTYSQRIGFLIAVRGYETSQFRVCWITLYNKLSGRCR